MAPRFIKKPRPAPQRIVSGFIRNFPAYLMLGLLSVVAGGNAAPAFAFGNAIRQVLLERPLITARPMTPFEKHLLRVPKSNDRNNRMGPRLRRLISRKALAKGKRGALATGEPTDRIPDREKIRVVLRGQAGLEMDIDGLKARGAKILNARSRLVAVEVAADEIENLIDQFGGISYARLPFKFFSHGTTSEGVLLTGASELNSAGYTGAGIKVAVIDLGFKGLSAAQASGDIPYSAITHDFTGTGLETRYKHGTGCAEIICDMAPDAQIHLLKIADEVDFYNAVDYCVTNDIDIISLSVGTFGSGPGDGTGPLADICDNARANGILVIASAGNGANFPSGDITVGTHWKGVFVDQGVNDWWNGGTSDVHQFIPNVSTSYYNAIAALPYQDDDGNPENDDVSIVMRWNDWPAADIDYDMYLFAYETGALVAYSNEVQDGSQPPLESIVIDLPDSENYAHYYYLVVAKPNGEAAGTEFELFLGGNSFFVPVDSFPSLIATSSSSITEPADAQSVFSVGAIGYSQWTTGPQEDFSSQGPTNAWAGSSARVKPDIAGPDGVSGLTYGPASFYGTSAAAPHVAGAAALVLSMHPNLSPDQLQSVLESGAPDMGAAGKDNLYGWGRLNMNVYNTPPVLTLVGDKSVNEGETLSFRVTGMDPDGDSISFSASNLPPGANFESAPAQFDWTPGYDQAGLYTGIHFEISDGMDTDQEDIAITVSNVYYDINDSGAFDLQDAILALQICAGIVPGTTVYKEADIDGDGKIGLKEAIFALQMAAETRSP